MPFKDIEAHHDDADRFRIIAMQREMDRIAGVSWNQPRLSAWQRFNALPSYKIWAALPAVGMGALIIAGFFVAADTGFVPPQRIMWVESWSAARSSDDAVADRAMALARLNEDINRTLAVVEPRAATDEDAATHAAALRRYAAMAEQEARQRERELDALRKAGLDREQQQTAAGAAAPRP